MSRSRTKFPLATIQRYLIATQSTFFLARLFFLCFAKPSRLEKSRTSNHLGLPPANERCHSEEGVFPGQREARDGYANSRLHREAATPASRRVMRAGERAAVALLCGRERERRPDRARGPSLIEFGAGFSSSARTLAAPSSSPPLPDKLLQDPRSEILLGRISADQMSPYAFNRRSSARQPRTIRMFVNTDC